MSKELIGSLSLEELADELNKYCKTGVMSEKLESHIRTLEEYKRLTEIERKIFKEYYSMYEKARQLERESKIDAALDIYLLILNKYEPQGTVYYTRPCIILEKQQRYDEAISICERAIQAIKDKKLDAGTDEFEERLNRLQTKKDKKRISSSDKKEITTKSKSNIIPSNTDKSTLANDIVYPDWYISLSFGKSSSKNYPQAVALAKMAPQYLEQEVGKNIIHQAIYSAKPDEYLQFIKLYELVSDWKSCFVVINGQVVDRKIVGGLNYCYGDRCRSGNPEFCYGASIFTENPFGCHRIQSSAWNNPWWTFGAFDDNGNWHIDKEAILERITEYSQPYSLCPSFSWDKALDGLERLPDVINPNKDPDWARDRNGVIPKSRLEPIASYTINLGLDAASTNGSSKSANVQAKSNSSCSGCGCLTIIAVIVFLWLWFIH